MTIACIWLSVRVERLSAAGYAYTFFIRVQYDMWCVAIAIDKY
ncbi:hypothetical protein [Nostoc sp.]